MGDTAYTLDNKWDKARHRLTALERLADPCTFRYLEQIGVSQGWSCLEVGAGFGTVADWLCQRVGTKGTVVATDIEPHFLERLHFSHLEVRQHNIVTDRLEADKFDLVHARCLLMHLPERGAVLRKLTNAVKPGGWILLEEPDFASYAVDASINLDLRRLYAKVGEEVSRHFRVHGAVNRFGIELYGRLNELGFQSLQANGATWVIRGGTPEAEFDKLTVEQFKQPIVASGQITATEYDAYIALMDNPAFIWRTMLMMSAWGRK